MRKRTRSSVSSSTPEGDPPQDGPQDILVPPRKVQNVHPNGNQIISEEQRENIRNYRKFHPDMTFKDIAKRFGVSKDFVAKLLNPPKGSQKANTPATQPTFLLPKNGTTYNPAQLKSPIHLQANPSEAQGEDTLHSSVAQNEGDAGPRRPFRVRALLDSADVRTSAFLTIEDIENSGRRLLQPLLNAESDQNPKLKNLQRVRQIEQYLHLKRCVSPTIVSKLAPALDLEHTPVQANRRFIVDPQDHIVITPKQGKFIKIRDLGYQEDTSTCMKTEKFALPKDPQSFKDVLLYGQCLCRAMDRMPCDLRTGSFFRYHGLSVVQLVALDAFQSSNSSIYQAQLPAIILQNKSDRPYYHARPLIINRDGQAEVVNLLLSAKSVNPDAIVPAIPTHIKLANTPKLPANLSASEARVYEAALAHLTYALWKCHGKLAEKSDVLAFWGECKSKFRASANATSQLGPYEGNSAFTTRVTGVHMRRIYMGRAPIRDIHRTTKKDIPGLRVYSIARTRLNKVLEVWNANWERTSDFLCGYISAAEAADYTNEAIETGEPQKIGCSCDSSMETFTMHPCDTCDATVLCYLLRYHSMLGLRLCPSCKGAERPEEDEWRDLIKYRIKAAIRRDHGTKNAGAKGGTSKVLIKQINTEVDALFEFCKSRPGFTSFNAIPDAYVSGRIRSNTLDRKRHPFTPSLDATRPFYRDGNGDTRIHCEGNVEFTAIYLNYGCNRFVKGTLPTISNYLLGHLGLPEFARNMACIADLAKEVPWEIKKRMKTEMSVEQYRLQNERWRTLQPRILETRRSGDASNACDIYSLRRQASADIIGDRPGWKPVDFQRITSVISDILKDSKRPIPRAPDGAPYPFEEIFMPENWSWWTAWTVFGKLFSTLWLFANGAWRTADDIETLYLEAIYQFAYPEENKEARFLNLPMHIWPSSPIGVSLGHRTPAIPLITGFRSSPKGLQDRISECANLSFETRFENLAKSNFSKDHYPAMRNDILGVKISTDYLDSRCLHQHVDEIPRIPLKKGDDSIDGRNMEGVQHLAYIEMMHEDIQGWRDLYGHDEEEPKGSEAEDED